MGATQIEGEEEERQSPTTPAQIVRGRAGQGKRGSRVAPKEEERGE